MTQTRPPFQSEATAPQMGQLRLALLMWKLQLRRVRGITA
jgi:hypothetical protein